MKTILTLSLAFGTASAYAQQDSADLARSVFKNAMQSQSTPTTTQSTNAVGETGGTVKPSTPATTTTSSSPSINPSAAAGQASQNAGAGANSAAGQALMAAGAALMGNPSTRPAGAALMAMGVLAMMQSAHDSGAAGQSAATFDASQFNSPTGTNSVGTGTSGFTDPQSKAAMQTLADNGYTVTAAGVTNPDGSFTPSSAFSSPSSMAAAGMDPAAVREAQKVTDALNDEIGKGAHVSSVPVAGGGGGAGGDGGGGGGGSEDKLALPAFKNPFAMNAADKKKLVAGKTVMFDGEPIGVSGQNIFDMVHAAYDKKRALNNFIENDTGGAAQPTMVRGPASLPQFKKK